MQHLVNYLTANYIYFTQILYVDTTNIFSNQIRTIILGYLNIKNYRLDFTPIVKIFYDNLIDCTVDKKRELFIMENFNV